MRRFVIGDIHGNHRALVQCLDAVKFDFDNDQLILIGDICDGYPDTYKCVELLMRVKNLLWCLGNHDLWMISWLNGSLDLESKHRVGTDAHYWYYQGGASTVHSYKTVADGIREHYDFWLGKPAYYHRINNFGFVHAGVLPGLSLESHITSPDGRHTLLWDRNLYYKKFSLPDYDIRYADGIETLFVGHTEYIYGPFISDSLINIDTGAGYKGRLTIMNIDTKEYKQSDPAPTLYPGYKHDSFI